MHHRCVVRELPVSREFLHRMRGVSEGLPDGEVVSVSPGEGLAGGDPGIFLGTISAGFRVVDLPVCGAEELYGASGTMFRNRASA